MQVSAHCSSLAAADLVLECWHEVLEANRGSYKSHRLEQAMLCMKAVERKTGEVIACQP